MLSHNPKPGNVDRFSGRHSLGGGAKAGTPATLGAVGRALRSDRLQRDQLNEVITTIEEATGRIEKTLRGS